MEWLLISTTGLDSPVLVSSSDRIILLNPNQPLQGHLALTTDIDRIVYVICHCLCYLIIIIMAIGCNG